MNNILKSLVVINIKNMFSSSFLSSKKKKTGMIILFSFLAIYLLGFGFYMAWQMAQSFLALGKMDIVLFIGFLITFVVLLFNTMFSANLYIFKAKDFDTLISLPIKKSTIVLSKFISLLLLCYVYSFFTFFPFALVYLIFAFNIWSLFLMIFSFAIFPLFAIFIGFLISFIVNLISKSFKNSNIIIILLSLVFVVGIIYLNTSFGDLFTIFLTNTESTMSFLNVMFFPIFFATKAIASLNLLNLLYFILISIIPILIVGFLLIKHYVKINSLMQSSAKVKKFQYEKSHSKSIIKTLINKEFYKLFSSPNYFLNSCMAPIILLLISGVTVFYDVFGLGAIPSTNDLFATLFFISSLFLLMNGPLCVTYSLEGNTFWQLKVLPITFKQITTAKYIMYLLVYFPAAILGGLFFGIAYSFSFWLTLLLIVLLCSCVLMGGLISLIINLKHNNIHYTNEIVIIKQSVGVLINLLMGVAISASIYFLYILWLINVLNIYVFFSIVLVAIVVATIILYSFIKRKGELLFKAIK